MGEPDVGVMRDEVDRMKSRMADLEAAASMALERAYRIEQIVTWAGILGGGAAVGLLLRSLLH